MASGYTPGQVLTAAELNGSFDEKVDGDNAAITGGFAEGLDHVYITGTVDSTAPTNGALTIAGGVGVALNLQVGQSITAGGSVFVNGTTNTTTTTTGALVVAGGVGIGKDLNVGGSLSIAGSFSANGQLIAEATTDSTSTTTGSLVVQGGVGIAKSVNVGGSVNVGNNVTVGGTLTVNGALETDEVIILSGGAGVQFADGTVQTTAGVIDGEFPITTTGGTITIAAADAAANTVFKVSGALTSDVVVVFPAKAKVLTLQNSTTNGSGSHTVTAKVVGQTPSASVLQGTAGTLFTDSTGCYATSAASGIGFSGEFPDPAGLTLSLQHLGGYVLQTNSGITDTFPLAASFPAGKGITIGNKSNGSNTLAFSGSDTHEVPSVIMAGDVYFAVSDGVSNWSIGWYSATKHLRVTDVTFGDGTTQTTALGLSQATETYYTVGATDTVGSFAAGDTSLRTAGFVAPYVDVLLDGLLLYRGIHYTLNADGVHINLLIDPLKQDDQILVRTRVVYNPSTVYAPSLPGLAATVGASFIPFAHVQGAAFLCNLGGFLRPGVDYTDDNTGFYLTNWSVGQNDEFSVLNMNPISFGNVLAKTANLSDVGNANTAMTNLGVGRPYARVTISTSPSITPGVPNNLLAFDTPVLDSGSYWSNATRRWTPQVAGVYLVKLISNISAVGGIQENRQVIATIRKNGVAYESQGLSIPGVTASTYPTQIANTVWALIPMNGTTDYLDFTTSIGAGTSANVNGPNTHFEAFRISAS